MYCISVGYTGFFSTVSCRRKNPEMDAAAYFL